MKLDVWDKQGLKNSLGNMSSLFDGLVNAFIESMSQRRQQLITTQTNNVNELYHLAHSIKGSAGQMYCSALVTSTRRLETLCLEGDSVGAERQRHVVLEDIDILLEQMNDALNAANILDQEQS